MTNLGYRTDCIFHEEAGSVQERTDHWVIRTPSNPTFWYGNFLLFKRAPQPGDLTRWQRIHAEEFGDTLNHITLGWDESRPGETEQFSTAGFNLDIGIVLTLANYAGGARINPELTVRPVVDEDDWREVIAIQQLCDQRDFGHADDGGEFRTRQAAAARSLVAAGRGQWWGAYRGDTLLSSLGLFVDRTGTLGRFQYISTHPNHRRQRACTTLLDHVVRHVFATAAPRQLVINTGNEEPNPAKIVYHNLGFRPATLSYAVTRQNPPPVPARAPTKSRDG